MIIRITYKKCSHSTRKITQGQTKSILCVSVNPWTWTRDILVFVLPSKHDLDLPPFVWSQTPLSPPRAFGVCRGQRSLHSQIPLSSIFIGPLSITCRLKWPPDSSGGSHQHLTEAASDTALVLLNATGRRILP